MNPKYTSIVVGDRVKKLTDEMVELFEQPFKENNCIISKEFNWGYPRQNPESRLITLTARISYAKEYLGYNQKEFAYIVNYYPTGGLFLSAHCPFDNVLYLPNEFTRRLSPKWTKKQLKTALENLASKAIDRMLLNEEVLKLHQRFEEANLTQYEHLDDVIQHVKETSGFTDIYKEMTKDDVIFWNKWLDNMRRIKYTKDDKEAWTIIAYDEASLNPDPSHVHELMLKDGWNPAYSDPIPDVKYHYHHSYLWDN